MISMLRKEACSGSTHDLAHISTQNCLADCLTMASAKADNLIYSSKTRKLLEVDIHPNFRTLMEHKAFLSTWCKTFMHIREKDVFFLNTLKVSLAPTPHERPFHVMFVRNSTLKNHKNRRIMTYNYRRKRVKKDGHNGPKITSALADTNFRFFRPVTSSFVEILCAHLFLVTIFLTMCYCPFSPSVVTMSSSKSADF